MRRADAGLCVPPEDPGRLTEAIMTLRYAPELRDRLGRNGRRHALRHHSVETAAARFEELFREARESKKGRQDHVIGDVRN